MKLIIVFISSLSMSVFCQAGNIPDVSKQLFVIDSLNNANRIITEASMFDTAYTDRYVLKVENNRKVDSIRASIAPFLPYNRGIQNGGKNLKYAGALIMASTACALVGTVVAVKGGPSGAVIGLSASSLICTIVGCAKLIGAGQYMEQTTGLK
jgi:hypothetical protein